MKEKIMDEGKTGKSDGEMQNKPAKELAPQDEPITQSRRWQKLQDDLGEESFFEAKDGYQFLAIKKKTPVGNYLFLPYGPLAKDQKSFQRALEAARGLAKAHKAIFIRLEPRKPAEAEYLPNNAKKVKDIDPADTWVLNLSAPEDEIIKNFSQGTRTRYNTYAKKGLTVETTKDISQIAHLVKLQRQLFEKKHLTAYDDDYLKRELSQPFATLYLVKYDEKIIAASLFFDHDGTRYYMQSAADKTFRKLPATVALLTTAIFDAKEQGIKHFDFWGIAPDGASQDHPWYGFTEFKKSFGGHAVHYAGTYDLPLNPAKYTLYKFLKRLKH